MANQIISLYLPDEVAMQLSIYCNEHASNRSAVIRKAIEEYLQRMEKK